MTEHDQACIFEAFEQAEAGRQIPGSTGLGLAISCQLVQLLGGHLQVSSCVGQGSTFYFTIPLPVRNEVWENINESSLTDLSRFSLSPSKYHILVVDDQPTNQQLVCDALTPIGFELILADTGQQAIELWERDRPHLILIDNHLPDQTGCDVVRQIRAIEQTQSAEPVPIIMISASVLNDEQPAAIAAGCQDFIGKPIQLTQLIHCIAQHLDMHIQVTEPREIESTLACPLITPDDLGVMPKEWVENLREAALLCHTGQIDRLIVQIPKEQAQLKQALAYYSYNIDIERILYLVQSYLDG
jgi:CheY-like chemotaxis protein